LVLNIFDLLTRFHLPGTVASQSLSLPTPHPLLRLIFSFDLRFLDISFLSFTS